MQQNSYTLKSLSVFRFILGDLFSLYISVADYLISFYLTCYVMTYKHYTGGYKNIDPLTFLFCDLPPDYCLLNKRHKRLNASQFFMYDESHKCLRPRLPPDKLFIPRLANSLVKDIQNKTVLLNSRT
ncbi:hypothetical protein BDB01DRAFT_840379 [Pilobolus umbonatus]|nr:hypothetical protein BDB01DRAFT_840379 [Pilobolus umbonatus]